MREGKIISEGSMTIFLGRTNGRGMVRRTVTSNLTSLACGSRLIEVICLEARKTIHPPIKVMKNMPMRFATGTNQGRPAPPFQCMFRNITPTPKKHIEPARNVPIKKPVWEGAVYNTVSPALTILWARYCVFIFCGVAGPGARPFGGGNLGEGGKAFEMLTVSGLLPRALVALLANSCEGEAVNIREARHSCEQEKYV